MKLWLSRQIVWISIVFEAIDLVNERKTRVFDRGLWADVTGDIKPPPAYLAGGGLIFPVTI